jgi:hypothetical protein
MRDKTSHPINWHRIARAVAVSAIFAASSLSPGSAAVASEDEVRAAFQQFVTAQNAHDVKPVEGLLLPSPDFLWITRGAPIWGKDAALQRFSALYQGTWHLDPGGERSMRRRFSKGRWGAWNSTIPTSTSMPKTVRSPFMRPATPLSRVPSAGR